MVHLICQHQEGLILIHGSIAGELITTSAHDNVISALSEWWEFALGFGCGDLDAGEDFELKHEWPDGE